MKRNFVVAAGLMSVIFMIGFVHAPVLPVAAGAALACVWMVWRARRGR
ncbi:MAG: hypothetical protein HY271_19295 [Deltaproteobacteria bacterium]|nr:hypothetical protein [Deltaproteobacteria bacterium]